MKLSEARSTSHVLKHLQQELARIEKDSNLVGTVAAEADSVTNCLLDGDYYLGLGALDDLPIKEAAKCMVALDQCVRRDANSFQLQSVASAFDSLAARWPLSALFPDAVLHKGPFEYDLPVWPRARIDCGDDIVEIHHDGYGTCLVFQRKAQEWVYHRMDQGNECRSLLELPSFYLANVLRMMAKARRQESSLAAKRVQGVLARCSTSLIGDLKIALKSGLAKRKREERKVLARIRMTLEESAEVSTRTMTLIAKGVGKAPPTGTPKTKRR